MGGLLRLSGRRVVIVCGGESFIFIPGSIGNLIACDLFVNPFFIFFFNGGRSNVGGLVGDEASSSSPLTPADITAIYLLVNLFFIFLPRPSL